MKPIRGVFRVPRRFMRDRYAVLSEGFDFDGAWDDDLPDEDIRTCYRIFHADYEKRRAGIWDFDREDKSDCPNIWITCPSRRCKNILAVGNFAFNMIGFNGEYNDELGLRNECIVCFSCRLHIWVRLVGYEKYLLPRESDH